MSDFIEDTKAKAAGTKSNVTPSNTVNLLLEIHRQTGALKGAASYVNGETLPVVDENGQPVNFRGWHHQDILISNTPRTQLSRGGDCPPGYTSTTICGISCCVPIG